MALLARFDPPAQIDDFDGIANQHAAWDEFLSTTFNDAVRTVNRQLGVAGSQFYNPRVTDTTEPSARQDIVWRGFPLLLLQHHHGVRLAAFRDADGVGGGGRRHDEYLEWFVTRDGTGKVTKVSFTCEGPEYWEALAHGYPHRYRGPRNARATGSKDKVLALYREHISADVQMNDLFDADGLYDNLNQWNTTRGAMHLTHPANNLGAEIFIAALATVLRKDGEILQTDANDLIECAKYGTPGRASDPRIGAEVNALARLGHSLTLANPIGLYIGGLDTTGWTTPNNKPAGNFWKIVRGEPGRGLRAVYEVPAAESYTVGDIKIAGVAIQFGGQIAERIDVKLTAVACRRGQSNNQPIPCEPDNSLLGAAVANESNSANEVEPVLRTRRN